MLPSAHEQVMGHCMAQLVYLDTVPAMARDGSVTVGDMADFYLSSAAGQAFLKVRFGSIEQEYQLWLRFLADDAQNWRDWTITGILDDNSPSGSGFYGCTFLSPQNLAVVAFRGSENLGNPYYKNDYRNDFSISYQVPTAQQQVVDRYLRRHPPSGSFWVVGHSLGGNLALYSAATMADSLWNRCQGCLAFNAPGFSGEFLEQYHQVLAERSPRIYALQNEYDIVSSLLRNPVDPVVVRSAYDPWAHFGLSSLMYPHSNFQFAWDDDGLIPLGQTEKCRLCQLANRLTEVILLLPTPLRMELSHQVLEAIYSQPSPEKQVQYALEALTKTLARHSGTGTAAQAAEVAYMASLLKNADLAGALYGYKAESGDFHHHQLARMLLFLLRARVSPPSLSPPDSERVRT